MNFTGVSSGTKARGSSFAVESGWRIADERRAIDATELQRSVTFDAMAFGAAFHYLFGNSHAPGQIFEPRVVA